MDQKCALNLRQFVFGKPEKKSILEEGNDVPKQSQKAALFPILPVNSYEKLCYFLILIFFATILPILFSHMYQCLPP